MAAIKILESDSLAGQARGLWLGLPLCAVGIAGLLRDAWPGALSPSGVNLHAIFGAMLWLIVVAQFAHASLAGPSLGASGVHELCRRLSRQVYLLLYVLFGLSQIARMSGILWNSSAQGAFHPATLTSPENLRDYLAYGVFALLTLHGLAAAQCQALKRLVVH